MQKKQCRACGCQNLFQVLDLGRMPLAGDFRRLGEKNDLYELDIDACEACGVLQIRRTVDHSVIFNSQYAYVSSTIPSLVRHFEDYAATVALTPGKMGSKKLLEVGCNDGIFLLPLNRAGYHTVGIDASENVVQMARSKGLDVKLGVFGRKTTDEILNQYGLFDVITCSNVFAHNPDIKQFTESVERLLSPAGEFWVEVHSAHALFSGLQWDCFYHEHCFYWTIHALLTFLEKYNLHLKSYQTTAMHGGALRAVFSRKIKKACTISERRLSLQDWTLFKENSLRSRELIRSAVNELPIHYAYGAAGRAVTLINWSGIADRLEFVVDGSPYRYGRVIPNTKIPIISEKEFFEGKDHHGWCFVTAHNYLDSIREKMSKNFPREMIHFVTPLPDVRIQ